MIGFKEFIQLNEGGAFGHLSNVYDVDMSFSDMKKLISDVLKGNLHYVEEKTDAVNLMVSYRADKGVMAARNKSHLKNFGENSMDAQGIRLKFKDRVLEHAYGKAMDDLNDAIKSLTPAQQTKIFANGSKWLSIEVMGHGAENIIEYGVRELRLHGTIEHNADGEKIGGIDKEGARMLDGMLRQRGTHKQSNYTIKSLNRVKLPQIDDFKKLEKRFQKELMDIMKMYRLKGSDTINTLRTKAWDAELSKNTKNQKLKDILINRWANFIKQPTISQIKKEFPDDAGWIQALEKQSKNFNKNIILPMEKLFLALGAERLKTMSEFMAINPDETVKKLAARIDNAVERVKKSGNPELLDKLELELGRLEATGKLMPTEGITFFWNGHFLKLTGSFAPANQIIGLLYRLDQ